MKHYDIGPKLKLLCVQFIRGTPTIGLIAISKVKKIGVEPNKDAVKDAIKNAKINKIENVYFENKDAGLYMVELAERGEKIDVVIMDPPRSGSDENFLSSLLKLKPKYILYISCNPETQARDLDYLIKDYMVEKIKLVDMFPQTYQFECGSKEIVLTLKESQLLELLIKRKGMIVSKENIIVKLWGYDTDAEDNRVEIHVSLLRKKLAQLDSDVYIHTIRGAGYILKTIRDGQ